jgi:hypothetical protein
VSASRGELFECHARVIEQAIVLTHMAWRIQMDPSEASSMTEASGITNDPDTIESMFAHAKLSQGFEQEALLRTGDLLRKVTLAAPLASLAIAFMAGILMARRR